MHRFAGIICLIISLWCILRHHATKSDEKSLFEEEVLPDLKTIVKVRFFGETNERNLTIFLLALSERVTFCADVREVENLRLYLEGARNFPLKTTSGYYKQLEKDQLYYVICNQNEVQHALSTFCRAGLQHTSKVALI